MNQEHGFLHPVAGYWQTNKVPSAKAKRAYPDGTVEVPIQPSPEHVWDGAAWFEDAANVAEKAEKQAEKQAKDAAKGSALEKLASSAKLTSAELAALFGGGNG